MYTGQPCHRGHLYPAQTASGHPTNPANSVRSTYQYTNAVPQCAAFNTGQWGTFEARIRTDAVQCTAGGGEMFLVTGISFAAIQNTQPPTPVAAPITTLGNGGIHRPNSMWTQGTCLYPNGQCTDFVVIGNNVNPPGTLTQQITPADLGVILAFDIQTNNLKRDRSGSRRRVKLFPGVRGCRYKRLPKEATYDNPRRGSGKAKQRPETPSKKPPPSSKSSSKSSSKHKPSSSRSSSKKRPG